jgi:beta-lactamase regulating signal transducer with metallopeptidase domain
MEGLSQSAFLQALGWATLNSFWQMALLWCVFLLAGNLFRLSAQKKYYLSTLSIIGGAVWFFITFFLYYNTNATYNFNFAPLSISPLKNLTPDVLTAASVAYLALLLIPAYQLSRNWKSIQILRKKGLQKAEIHYRLFVKKIASRLGIKKAVGVYFSSLVKSPLTIGYLKPIILLPIASITNLTLQQVEAVLLHELSHIRRYDYLVNILISIIQTILYFNPFTRLFIQIVQEERENCCDQMVLQFGYDKISYASALLSLEKTSLQSHSFVLGAVGKRKLLTRIEKIVGIEKKIIFRFNHLVGLAAALLCIFAFNSFLVIAKEKKAVTVSFSSIENPFYFFNEKKEPGVTIPKEQNNKTVAGKPKKKAGELIQPELVPIPPPAAPPPVIPLELLPVALNEAEINLSKEQKEHIKATIENTKKVLSTYQWKEVEKTIADGLTDEEKARVKQEYILSLNKIDWINMEKKLKTAYETINWKEIDANLQRALLSARMDSLQGAYEETLKTIEKAREEIKTGALTYENLPFPDASLKEVRKREEQVRSQLKEIKIIRTKKVIKL